MTRQEVREQTMQIIFQMDVSGEFDYEKLTPIQENLKVINKPQATETLTAIRDHIKEIDDKISTNIDNWTIERIAKADLAILRNAVAEILFTDLPKSIAINEAVELAKKYGDEKSYAFINSVLSKINK